jgi:hypothetical protein
VLVLVFAAVLPSVDPNCGIDFRDYLTNVQTGNWFHYLPWIKLLILPFTALPFTLSWFIWSLLGVISIWYAARVFGGNLTLALLSYPMFWLIWYGQISAILIGFIALAFICLRTRLYLRAGILLAFAATKPQLGVPVAAALVLLYVRSWYARLIVLLGGLLVVLVWSVYDAAWPEYLFNSLRRVNPGILGSITLWHQIGIWSLLLWLLLALPQSRRQRLVLVAALSALSMPYYQLTGLLLLFVMTDGTLALASNIGFFTFTPDGAGLRSLSTLPAFVLSTQLIQAVKRRQRRPFAIPAEVFKAPTSSDEMMSRSNYIQE